jgi:hypothetical protein
LFRLVPALETVNIARFWNSSFFCFGTTDISKRHTTIKIIIAIMSSAPASRPRATMSASMNYEWLWVDDPIIITRWFITQPRLSYKEFYASFMNSANKALERSRQRDCLALEGLPKFIVALLHKQPIPAEELLAAFKAYAMDDLGNGHGRYKTKGLLPFGRGLSKSPTLP